MAIVTAEIRFAPQLAAWFTANPTLVLADGELAYCSDGANAGKYKMGDGTTQLSALTFYGGVSASGLTIGTTTITSGTNTRILYNNAGVVGEYLVTGTGTTAVLSTSPTFTNTAASTNGITITNTTNNANVYSGVIFIADAISAGQSVIGVTASSNSYVGASKSMWYSQKGIRFFADGTVPIDFCINGVNTPRFEILGTGKANFNAQTQSNNAGVNSPILKSTGSTSQWATGALATQYFNYFSANTVAFAGASTATLAANFVADYVQGGTNATITTNAAIYVPTLALTNTTTGIGLYAVAPSGATTNYAAYLSGLTLVDNANLRVGSGTWNNYQFEVVKSQNTVLQAEVRNSSNGASAYTEFTVRGDSTQQMRFGSMSSGFTTSGLITATTSYCMSAGVSTRTLYGHISTANDIIFVNGGFTTTDEAMRITPTKNVTIGNAALATTATDGFLYVTSCAGPPTGVPTAITGRIPIVADSTNNKLYIYSGGAWVALN